MIKHAMKINICLFNRQTSCLKCTDKWCILTYPTPWSCWLINVNQMKNNLLPKLYRTLVSECDQFSSVVSTISKKQLEVRKTLSRSFFLYVFLSFSSMENFLVRETLHTKGHFQIVSISLALSIWAYFPVCSCVKSVKPHILKKRWKSGGEVFFSIRPILMFLLFFFYWSKIHTGWCCLSIVK